jgi:hypothetical protein
MRAVETTGPADVPLDVRDDFLASNRLPIPIDADGFGLSIPVRILSRDSVLAIDAQIRARARPRSDTFLGRHPFVDLSRVGFSRDSTLALVYVGEHCGGHCGTGWEVHLRRVPNGAWRITRVNTIWIA